MQFSTIIFFVSHSAFAVATLMLLLTIRGLLDYQISKDRKLINYIGLSITTAFYAGGDVAATFYHEMPFGFYLYHWLWAAGFFCSFFYIKVIADFLDVRAKFMRFLFAIPGIF